MSYNLVARYYDKLSRLVFGDTLLQDQSYFLDRIPNGSKVLIAGGGTGWILEAITSLHPSLLEITYVDSSMKMTELAKMRNVGNNQVTFIIAQVETISADHMFDIVITPFFFDNFKEYTIRKIFSAIEKNLDKDGIWLYTDFRNTKGLGQKLLLKIMYAFFRLFCGIEAGRLPDMGRCFGDFGYAAEQQMTFMNGFVETVVYKRY